MPIETPGLLLIVLYVIDTVVACDPGLLPARHRLETRTRQPRFVLIDRIARASPSLERRTRLTNTLFPELWGRPTR